MKLQGLGPKIFSTIPDQIRLSPSKFSSTNKNSKRGAFRFRMKSNFYKKDLNEFTRFIRAVNLNSVECAKN